MPKNFFIPLMVFFLLQITVNGYSQNMVANARDLDKIADILGEQLLIFPQEKIHLHTDRAFYVPGERIRFKAYLADAATHQPTIESRYLYAELIDSRDSLVSRVMVRPENDMFHGHLFLSEIIPEGDYTLRAYTRYMENLGDDYFFKKNIRIGNLTTETESGGNRTGRENRESRRSRGQIRDDFDVSFFPEGGNLIEGVMCKITFKALNRNGFPETISGEIMDESGATIATVHTYHAGMGVFACSPELGKRYFLKCRNENGLEKQFELPQPVPHACALTVSRHNKRISVGIRKSARTREIRYSLLAHCRGVPFYFAAWDGKSEFVAFSEDDLPSGVIQFILFDEQMNPLSERLVFSKNNDAAKVDFQTDKTSYEKREKVALTLSISDSDGNLLNGHLSVAVTDDMDIAVDASTTILSSLLLSSELKGYIEDPAWYMQDNIRSTTALDYLMMTHGWRRYHVPEVVRGNPEYPTIAYQTSQEISGAVKTVSLSKPVVGSEVFITVKEGDFGLMYTGEEGEFLFQDFEFPDSTSFFIQALNKKGSNQVELLVDGESFPKPIYAPQSPSVKDIKAEQIETESKSEPDAFLAKAEQRAKFDEDMRLIHLSEVVITASRIERKEEPRLQYWANRSSDETIQVDEIKKRTAFTATDLLRQNANAGVVVYDNGIISIRRAYETLGYLPLVIIDGLPFDWSDGSPLENINAHEVVSIDIFKGVSTTAFGVRGAGGVISITTGVRENMNSAWEENYTVYTPLGYQKPVEFYAPKYETLEAKYSAIPDYRTTIFWKPDLVISEEDEAASFEFYASDFKTTYSVVIEGLTTEGKIVRQVETIRVE